MSENLIFTKRIKVPVVVNTGEAQVLIVTEIPLTPPAFALDEVHKTVRIEQCKVITDKVIINGILTKNINFKAPELKDCFDDNRRVCGDLRFCQVDIPFHLFVEVPGALEGDDCQLEEAVVVGQKHTLMDVKGDCFSKLLEKDVVKVVVKVTRQEQIDVPVVPPKQPRC